MSPYRNNKRYCAGEREIISYLVCLYISVYAVYWIILKTKCEGATDNDNKHTEKTETVLKSQTVED